MLEGDYYRHFLSSLKQVSCYRQRWKARTLSRTVPSSKTALEPLMKEINAAQDYKYPMPG